ncbi:MAG TPA: HAD family hydrolase [Candidatus Binatia bacterium]|nr:HAD family hydrolase [Candidatus Binatia bacterium]
MTDLRGSGAPHTFRSVRECEAIAFDFGGTLDGPGEPWVERFAVAYRDAGVDVAPGDLHEAAGYGTRQAYHTAAVASFSLRETIAFHVSCQFAHLQIENPLAADRIGARFLARTEAALAESRVVLTRLAARRHLAVISNFYGNVERILADAGFAPLLATVLDSTVVGISKPDPRIFTLAAERLGFAPHEVLYVGDSFEHDIVPAHTAGLRTAWLTGRSAVANTRCDLRIVRLSDLEQLI